MQSLFKWSPSGETYKTDKVNKKKTKDILRGMVAVQFILKTEKCRLVNDDKIG